MATTDYTTALCEALHDAAEMLWIAHESFCETDAQHRAECAAFGDSWPGALHDIARCRDGIAAAEAEHRACLRALGLE